MNMDKFLISILFSALIRSINTCVIYSVYMFRKKIINSWDHEMNNVHYSPVCIDILYIGSDYVYINKNWPIYHMKKCSN